jgi:hypothetical protein
MMLALRGVPDLTDGCVIYDRRDTAFAGDVVATTEVCDTLPCSVVPGSRPAESSEEAIGAVACREWTRFTETIRGDGNRQ